MTPSPTSDLRATLLRLAVVKHVRPAEGGTFVDNGLSCRICKAQCERDQELVHTPDCHITRLEAGPAEPPDLASIKIGAYYEDIENALKRVIQRRTFINESAVAEVMAEIFRGPAEPTRDTSGWRDGYDAALRGDTNRVGCYEREFYPLSNFSSFQIGAYKTAEHLYHSHKFTSVIKDGEVIWPGRYDILDAVQYAPSAHEAFKIAERHKKDRRPDWDAVKLDVMRRILREKATQHEYVRRKLMETGDREIVEDSWRDDYWGLGPNGDGQNWLGKLWMEVRAELRALPPSPQGQTP